MEHPGTEWIAHAPGDGTGDAERATRGFVAAHPTGVIERDGRPIWDTGRYDFLRDRADAPDTVHPSLWRQARPGLLRHRQPQREGGVPRYLGWFDGNPANLHPLPPVESASRTVEWMGGSDAVLERARHVLEADPTHEDLRWLAQALDHVVFADPDRADARELQADVLERLGFASESAPWRNFYLTGAQELRSGTFQLGNASLGGFAPGMTTAMLFDALGVRLRPEAVAGFTATLEWTLTDRDEVHVAGISNRALFHSPGRWAPDADARITTTAPVRLAHRRHARPRRRDGRRHPPCGGRRRRAAHPRRRRRHLRPNLPDRHAVTAPSTGQLCELVVAPA